MSVPPSSSLPTDRRAHRRALLDRPVMVTSARTYTARTVNVSGGGLALRTDEDMSLGARVNVYFELPIGFGVETDAEVIRREGDLIVVRFVEASAQSVLAIRSFCRLSGISPKVVVPGP